MTTKIKNPAEAAQASYERGILTLDLPRAVQPMLWRQEIKNISNIAFWVTVQDNGEHALLMKISSSSAEQTIARFKDDAAAAEALQSIREIFIANDNQQSIWTRLLKIVFWVLLVWVVGTFTIQLIGGFLIPKKYLTDTPPAAAATAPADPNAAPAAQAPPQIHQGQ